MIFRNDRERRNPVVRAADRVSPLLPLRDIIVFPHMVSQLFVGRDKSIAALDEAMARDKEIFLAAQKSAKTNDPTPEDIYAVGTVGTIVQLLRLADGTVKVLIEGRQRAKVRRYQRWRPWQVDHQTVETAWGIEARFGVPYWDALIVASAQHTGCGYLLTEDLQHGQQLGAVTVMNPFSVQPHELLSADA